MLAPLSTLQSSLRLGTFNVGCGFSRKLPTILARSVDLSLDIVALQEIGDPALHSNNLSQYSLAYSGGPSQHEAGVGLLLSHDLAPLCRTYKRSPSGRLVGAVLELARGHQLLVVSAYMPTGLDHRTAADAATKTAHALYTELITWTLGMQQVIVLGDLNETLTPHDRHPRPAAAASHRAADSPIQCLVREGFVDAYRIAHSDPARFPGFTHSIRSAARDCSSRIDYIWTLGCSAASVLKTQIDASLHHQRLSAHRLLWMELELTATLPPPSTTPLHHVRIPNVRGLTDRARTSFAKQLQRRVSTAQFRSDLDELASRDDAISLSLLAQHLTSIAHDAAFSALPLIGSAPYQNKPVLRLEAQRRDLTRLLHFSCELAHDGIRFALCPAWTRLFRHCLSQHQVAWTVDAHCHAAAAAWLDETRRMVCTTRADIRRAKQQLDKVKKTPLDASPAATVHRMLENDAFPTQLFSVIDANGELTTSPDDLKRVMAAHFEGVFAVPPAAPRPLEPAPPPCLFAKPGVDPAWYDGLMSAVAEDELMAMLDNTPTVSAPGEDGVSTAVWKLALQESSVVRRYVIRLFDACLSTSTFPSAWKTGVILPFVKDAQKDRTMGNIRPITLQSCLGKLFNKLLAHRLGSICARHPILHPAQRGFITGGTTVKCIDELLDAWDWSRCGRGRELYTLFYDIKQAYDSVQIDVLVRALHRLRLPAAFVALIADSLTGLESCVRTIYGHSRRFAVHRSLRQGDPLAPLLFVLLMDALHCGLERNPFTLEEHGCRLAWPGMSVYLASLGYADDTTVLANTLAALRIQNDWVQYFMSFNRMRLNSAKCELVGRRADGQSVTTAEVALAGIDIEGAPLQPAAHDYAIRYLGAHCRFDGQWSTQFTKSVSMISMFTRVVAKFSVPVSQAVFMFTTFLMPKLELALKYAHGAGTSEWIKNCDRLLMGCIKHAIASPLRLSHTALALTLGLHLPSRMEASVKVSELFLRMNSSDVRWGQIGRLALQYDAAIHVDAASPLHRANSGSRLSRATYLAVRVLGWEVRLLERRPAGRRRQHLFDSDPAGSLPSLADCTSAPLVTFAGGSAQLAHDAWSGWGTAVPEQSVQLYTDGSFDAANNTSAWSVALGDAWLLEHFRSIPADERALRAAHVARATLVGASIVCTRGVYPAELQAIARALAMLPLSFSLELHSDSQASITAIRSFVQQPNERKRLRMSARPLLQLIHSLIGRRTAAGGSVDIRHVRAHSDGADLHSVGNRLADYQASLARSRPDQSTPLTLSELPLERCERHCLLRRQGGAQIIDDVRRTALLQLRADDLAKWTAKVDHQGRFAGAGMIELGRIALRFGTPAQQVTLLHVATNSIDFFWRRDPLPARTSSLAQVQCAPCAVTMSLEHLADCPAPAATLLRRCLRDDIVRCLSIFPAADGWLRRHSHVDLAPLLLRLFPAAVGVSAADRQVHIARCMLGAFTKSESSAAAKQLGLQPTPQDALCAMRDVRLLCLESIEQFYTPLKVSP